MLKLIKIGELSMSDRVERVQLVKEAIAKGIDYKTIYPELKELAVKKLIKFDYSSSKETSTELIYYKKKNKNLCCPSIKITRVLNILQVTTENNNCDSSSTVYYRIVDKI